MNERKRLAAGLLLSLAAAGVWAAVPATRHQHAHEAAEAKAWTARPLLEKAKGFSRSVALFRPRGMQADQLIVLPAIEASESPLVQQVDVTEGKGAVRTRGKRQGGWYRVLAEGTGPDGPVRAGTVVYFSNPGPAPRQMLANALPGLELVPVELPREHRHYRAGETWSFVVRRDGDPLTEHPVLFETAQGVSQSLFTDGQGVVRVTFPDDFPAEPEQGAGHGGHRRGPRTAFVLSTVAPGSGGGRMLAAFNYHYRPGPYAGKSLWLGGGFALLGMVAAVPLVIRRKPREGRS
jgi:hypothetical protein